MKLTPSRFALDARKLFASLVGTQMIFGLVLNFIQDMIIKLEDTTGCTIEMTSKLCCLINPSMTCGFCKERWCAGCYNKIYDESSWSKCPVPNTSGSLHGNHYTMDIKSTYPDVDMDLNDLRPLRKGEKVTDFEATN